MTKKAARPVNSTPFVVTMIQIFMIFIFIPKCKLFEATTAKTVQKT